MSYTDRMKRFLLCIAILLAACSPYSGPLIGSSDPTADGAPGNTAVSGGDTSMVIPGDGTDAGTTDAAANDSGDLAPPDCGDGGTVYTHNNGAGQAWQDCVPLGTYDMAEAIAACGAFCKDGSCTCSWGNAELPGGADAGTEHIAQAYDNTMKKITWTWVWDGPYAGRAAGDGNYPPYGNLVSWE